MKHIENIELINKKMLSLDELKRRVNVLQFLNQKVVFTNGCFDILHRGHVEYLAKAADMGAFLIVGLNSDASVKKQNKGADRPVNNQDTRAFILSALSFVNAIIIFEEDTPYELIKHIRPDILVKGSDYDANETNKESKKYIVGSDVVRELGGEVKTIALTEGYSTTGIINKLKS